MNAERVAVRHGAYADSVTLMRVSQQVSEADGVSAVLVAMATELNLRLLAEMGFAAPTTISANDLLIAIRARNADALAAAGAMTERLLDARYTDPPSSNGRHPPRTLGAAVRALHAELAVISVQGPHAFTEAMDALESGCNVMIFSDNVSVGHEIALKDAAGERGLLVMGPDCGTALVGGLALGFVHHVGRGRVGIVAASGTGAQQILCLLDAAGIGVSAVLGVGGRDLSDAVAGRSTLAALALLDADPTTDLVVVVSKRPGHAVARTVRSFAAGLRTPVRFAMLGPGKPDLTTATEDVLAGLGATIPKWSSWTAVARPAVGALRGLFCGGTLCEEAMLIASAALGVVRSNVPLRPEWSLDGSLRASGHVMIDFGDDALTQGRAHPMIDPTLRMQHLRSILDDPATGVVLLDVMLGFGSPEDPVAQLLPVVSQGRAPVVVSLIGARGDPQDLHRSAERLHRAGASVFTSNAAAARHAVSLLQGGSR